MLPSQRSKLTLSVLSRLKDKGAPTPMIRSFPLLGEEEGNDQQDQQAVGTQDEQGDALDDQESHIRDQEATQPQAPRQPRRKRLAGPAI